MNSPNVTKSIRRILNVAADRSKAVANGVKNQSSIPTPPSQNESVIAFFNSTIDGQYIMRQFRRLERRQNERDNEDDDSDWSTNFGRIQYDLNRYGDVIPYDATRVILHSEKDDRAAIGDYINASYVYTPKKTRRYIATQGPLENTIDQFWRMVYDGLSSTQFETASTIIMLTQAEEGGIEKSAEYWPPEIGRTFEIPYRPNNFLKTIVVKLIDQAEDRESDCVINTIELCVRDSTGRETPRHQIKHMRYNGWRDMSVPLSTETFLNYFHLYRKYHTSEASPIVHCSAGIGRTGVFIALDYLFTAVKEMTSEEILNDPVYETVDELRNWRPSMVCRLSQLEYIYTLFREIVLTADPNVGERVETTSG